MTNIGECHWKSENAWIASARARRGEAKRSRERERERERERRRDQKQNRERIRIAATDHHRKLLKVLLLNLPSSSSQTYLIGTFPDLRMSVRPTFFSPTNPSNMLRQPMALFVLNAISWRRILRILHFTPASKMRPPDAGMAWYGWMDDALQRLWNQNDQMRISYSERRRV